MNAYLARIAFAVLAAVVAETHDDDAMDHIERRLDARRPRRVDAWHGDYPMGVHPDQIH